MPRRSSWACRAAGARSRCPARRISSPEGELVQGTPLRLVVKRPGAVGEIDLGEAARFYPSDNALALWQRATQGASVLVYGEETT